MTSSEWQLYVAAELLKSTEGSQYPSPDLR